MAEYIEREALQADIRDSYQKLHEIYNGLKFENERAICSAELTTFCEILMRIKDWPAADVVEVRHGRWEDVNSYEHGERAIATCSHCRVRGAVRTKRTEYGFWVINSPMCPNCGARMDGE